MRKRGGSGRDSSYEIFKEGADEEDAIADAEKTEKILQEFVVFEEDVLRSSEDWMDALESSIQEPFDSGLPAMVSERLVSIVTLARSILDRYLRMHTGFLLDRKFSKKLRYLWRAEPDLTKRIIKKFMQNTVDPFFSGFNRKLQAFVVVQEDSEFQIRLQASIKDILGKSKENRDKLQAYYTNNLSAAHMLLTTTFAVLYTLKLIRMFIIAGALYLASQTFQSKYVTRVFVDNTDPPNLIFFVIFYVILETIFMSLVMFVVYLLKSVIGVDSVFPITDRIFKDFMVDYCISTIIIIVLGIMLAHVVMKKKYFRYKTDGMRAIRSLQEMMFYVACVVLLFPYFIIEV